MGYTMLINDRDVRLPGPGSCINISVHELQVIASR
jgi:hypothetical protein